MPEVRTAVQLITVNYRCDDCGAPISVNPTVPRVPTFPPRYLHNCTNPACLKRHPLPNTYPYTEHPKPLDEQGNPLQLHEHEAIAVFDNLLNQIEGVPDERSREILTGLAGLVKSMIEFHMGRVVFVPTSGDSKEGKA